MTYCLAIKLDSGLVFAGDTRTNAGVDLVATYRKLFTFGNGTTHAYTLLSSGNLATTQALVEQLNRSCQNPDGLFSDVSMFDSATRIGAILVDIIAQGLSAQANQSVDFSSNLLLGGQIQGEAPRLFRIYPQGNFIEATEDTPFLQIGEEKYGKPILDRIIRPETPIDRAFISALLSLNSTIKSNVSVGMPLDAMVYLNDSFDVTHTRRFEKDDPEFAAIESYWSEGLSRLINEIQPIAI